MIVRRRSIWLAAAVLMLWLGLAGALTWQRSRESVVPPLWDQQTYVQKANAVWSSISKGTGENPFNIEPSVRPPGTVLLTAPLGPLKDFRNFYFRSVFVPVVTMALSIFIAGVGVTRQPWESALLALLAASMPMFWQFEHACTDYCWGFVDTFQASLGALSMACFLVAAVRFERLWTLPALISLALLPLVKPSGFVVSGLIGLAWLAIALHFVALHPRGLVRGWASIIKTSLAIILVLGGVALASLRSNYFSAQNIEFGKVALTQLRGDWITGDIMNEFASLFTRSIGTPLLIAIGTLSVIALLRRGKNISSEYENRAPYLMAAVGLIVVIAGVHITYQSTLFRQARYFYPISAVAAILFIPILVSCCKRAGNLFSVGLTVIPVALLIFLASPRFNDLSFKFGGYGLRTGYGHKEVKAANTFFEKFNVGKKGLPLLYTTSDGIASIAFEAGFTQRLREFGLSDSQASQYITRPFNWESGGMIAISSIYNADIILIDSLSSHGTPQTSGGEFGQEVKAWKAWLATTPFSGSTEVLLKTPSMLALAVKDRTALEKRMRKFIASRRWRPEFIATNGRSEFTQYDVSSLHLNILKPAQAVDFGNALRVDALSISRVPDEHKISVSIFSEPLGNNRGGKYLFFIHQLDSKGEIIANHGIPIIFSRFVDRPVSLVNYSFNLTPKTTQLGVGIFEAGGGTLASNWNLAKDWEGRRAILNIKTLLVLPPTGAKN